MDWDSLRKLASKYIVECSRVKYLPFSFFQLQCHPFPWMLFQHPTPHPNWLWSGILPLFPMATSHTTSYDGSSNLRTVTFTDTITAPKVGKWNVVVLKRLWLLPASRLYGQEVKPVPCFTTLLWITASRREWVNMHCCCIHNMERKETSRLCSFLLR